MNVYENLRLNLEKARMKHIDEYCGDCKKPIYEGEGRHRLPTLRCTDCFKARYLSPEAIQGAAESAALDVRVNPNVKKGAA